MEGDKIGYNYGLEVVLSEEEVIYPIYPYANSKSALEEFLEVYEDSLKTFYEDREPWFSNYILGFDTNAKEEFKGRWYRRGVVIN